MESIKEFTQTVWDHYHEHPRDLPWRVPEPDGTFDPYKILVSEIMLQQTQALRVVPKYEAFLRSFPTLKDLAGSQLSRVLTEWSGLGYNRRAKFLWQAAGQAKGIVPNTVDELVKLPGIGHNTAAAIVAYSYNQPVTFIETNIRTVFIHHFFADKTDISDKDLLPIITQSLDTEHAREWYWALMDYGVFLKSTVGNVSRSSKHYAKQSKFDGSKRQIRGAVIKALANKPQLFAELSRIINDERLEDVLRDLTEEGMIQQHDKQYSL